MSNKALYAAWYVEDNWYGKRYRAILAPAEGEHFPNKTAANKYRSKLKKYIKKKFGIVVFAKEILFTEQDKLLEYEYISMGPSISYKHYNITVAEMEKFLEEEE